MRNAAVGGGVHNRRGAGPQQAAVGQFAQRLQALVKVKRGVIDGRHEQITGKRQCSAAHGFFTRPDRHFVDATRSGFARFAKAGLHAHQILQFDGDVLEDMRRPSALLQALHKATGGAHAAAVLVQAGQPSNQAVGKTIQLVGWIVFQITNIHPSFQHRAIRPQTGAAQVGDPLKRDLIVLHKSSSKIQTSRLRDAPKGVWCSQPTPRVPSLYCHASGYAFSLPQPRFSVMLRII